MQKRTNPLELKVDSKDYTPAPATAEPAAETTPVAPAVSEMPAPQPKEVLKPEPVKETVAEVEKEIPQVPQESAPASQAPQPVVPQEEEKPAPAPIAPDRVAPVRPGRPAPVRPVLHNNAEDRVRHGEHVADNDVALAVKLRVAGDHVERRMVLTRVSKDVCKLAQALYPGQSIGSIIESALLTKAFLQDRDAFDEAAREIIKKGGKIKC